MLRYLIPVLWVAAYLVLSYAAKRTADEIPSLSGGWGPLVRHLVTSFWAYLMVGLYPVCAVLYLVGLRLMPLTTAGPVFLILGVLATVGLGVLMFGEIMPPIKMAGVMLALVGIIMIFYQAPAR